ncbi:hypothetical protein [Citrobacter portucalensis]|uniref:hypothetical protein n=1 Tax=Citrobacter portucalensis TaxID=1639133 RepID=UPI00226B04ED|nr:hypothetical protein [Citrobacter portucalensis]MCX8984817.1 hypothetical protein [Citrobacter portucalensis]
MTALNKQSLRVPERKRRDWSQAVMCDCDFCNHWSLTVKHEDGGCICASCCDAEYTSELKGVLESAIERAEAAEKRIAELSASHSKLREGMAAIYNAICENGASTSLSAILTFVKRSREESATAAGIGVKGE